MFKKETKVQVLRTVLSHKNVKRCKNVFKHFYKIKMYALLQSLWQWRVAGFVALVIGMSRSTVYKILAKLKIKKKNF